MQSSSKREYLKENLVFWEKLTQEEQEFLLEHTSLMTIAKGEQLYSADHKCMGVILIKTGELRAYLLSEEGREITLYRLGAGEICVLSASCLLEMITFDVQIDAEQDTELFLVDAGAFAHLMEKNVYAENFSLKVTAEKFSEVVWVMEQMLFMKMDKRLAVFLLDESSKINSDAIQLTHEQIAKYMGSAREVVSRVLKHFEKENLVALTRNQVEILDKTRLRELAS